MENRRKYINNKKAYFSKVVKNMDLKDSIKNSKINEHEISINEFTHDKFSEIFDLDEQISEKNLLGWIELIENAKLHNAVKQLSVEDQIFISYIVKDCKTQKQISNIYKINQSCVSNKLNKIIRILKNYMFKK